ncbi:MAG: hypothetical protein ABL931_11005 [Usitatibacteraceae bacterium]
MDYRSAEVDIDTTYSKLRAITTAAHPEHPSFAIFHSMASRLLK